MSQTVDTIPRRRPFGPGSYLWEHAGLITFSLTTGAGFALQLMHPSVGTVVDEHSVFRTDAVGRASRSIASVQTWVYGGEEALAEGDRLRAMHAPLKSTDADGVTHHALASGPWAWIILTSPYAFTTGARYFSRRPLSAAERESVYAEIKQLMRNLHVVEKEIPPTYDDYLARFDEILDHTLVAHPAVHDFLATSRTIPPPPKLPRPLRPLWRAAAFLPGKLQHFVTVGTLPETARAKLGLTWTDSDERKLRRLGRVIATIVPLLPERLRYFPIAREARKAHRANQALTRTLATRPL
ncbi:oxygenase MpaB family protein [Saccharopolyspora sp. TS4A08]|uniref:Oxygenase MpaB family protein n=1 Tax=Saccharopolyspora ipomoeae TaxID=3042027 RepID=A0ABT6PID6_9PSEU|nr:oxygenase MpaB family protein [Saccharopolyspora sp. TS4A08]MDI2027712.1 oxygenase MpaB family protein [Saccharopolyspora sp. TS4A08]